MSKQDSENQGDALGIIAKSTSGADSIRNQLSNDLEVIMNKCAVFLQSAENTEAIFANDLYGDLMDFASKYAVDDFFDR